jgi:site-specific DNA-methyltransferase (adenine-specific)
MELNRIYCENNLETMAKMPNNFIDLTVTSPPYDNLRTYNGYCFDFESVAKELYRVTKLGGVVVWVVGDATVKGSETGTSFKQALYFMQCGFNLHDTMIYHKNSLPKNHNRYEQDFEFMFVFSKGKPKAFNPIKVPCLYPEKETARANSFFSKTEEINRAARSGKKRRPVGVEKIKGNIWKINTGAGHSTLDKDAFRHPAIFPESLANDHIISWSNESDLVYDPFMGSGTTAKIALKNNRKFIGSEISQEYCDIANKRINTYLTNGVADDQRSQLT